ncbi:hypothetical protein [Natronosalvus halobius]|uniref:hypothetical protein n=1 Tax=Natronosalvus halobius TaxID=2953746 RepID=UPI0020A202EF|nr:hypothetical protein [Natronosalvus halobius]USZ73762.1 hypothetical protein NGM15_18320 [Natronosalvus halobius]
MTDDTSKAEALLEEAKSQKRHETEPSNEPTDDSPSLEGAIVDAYAAIDAGDAHSNLTIRDSDLAALVAGLDETDGLGEIVADAQDELDREGTDADATKAMALGLLVRVGLSEVAPEAVETTLEAKKRHAVNQASEI